MNENIIDSIDTHLVLMVIQQKQLFTKQYGKKCYKKYDPIGYIRSNIFTRTSAWNPKMITSKISNFWCFTKKNQNLFLK